MLSPSPRPGINPRISGRLTPGGGRLASSSPQPSVQCSCQCVNCGCKITETSPLVQQPQQQQQQQQQQISKPKGQLSWKQKLPYYLPCLNWLPNYTTLKLTHDFISGLSLLSFQIPLLMSYATTVLHVPPICGLLAVAVAPIVYSIFGSIPQLIVGPEPSISIVVGGVVEPMLIHGNGDENPLDLVLVITCLSGFTLLGAGLLRFGFLDTVLSMPLLKGFIAAVGVVMVCNSSIEEFGLKISVEDHIHSPFDKLKFVFTHLSDVQIPTMLISLLILTSLLTLKIVKNKLMLHNYEKVIFLPEILITVVITTYLSYKYDWESHGISVVGEIHSTSSIYWKFPFKIELWKYYKPLLSSGFTCAILGFFESTTLSKALGSDTPVSSNRELVALGFVNIVTGTFGSLPLFGGYGRSKINLLSGGLTCASGASMGVVTIIVIVFCLKLLYHLPNCCLSCITTIVGITILEEIPKDLKFFIRTRGWEELITFCITFTFAFFVSMDYGIIMGTGYSIIRVLKNSSKSRIQILKRVPGTTEFISAKGNNYNNDGEEEEEGEEEDIDNIDNRKLQLEDVENCLIVKIPEPLIFTNANDLKLKLKRLEMYGSTHFHPLTPRFKPHLHFIIFDINEMTTLDSSSSQILLELIQNYHRRNIKIFLVANDKIPNQVHHMLQRSGIVGYIQHTANDEDIYFDSVEDVLKLIDLEPELSDVVSYRSNIFV